MKQNIMDFSVDTDFQERLLKKIKMECFSEVGDDDLELVSAAGVTEPKTVTVIIMPDDVE